VMTNHKGGVGKSTSATNIAFGMVQVLRQAGASNTRVLLIDTDSQGHCGRYLARPPLAQTAKPLGGSGGATRLRRARPRPVGLLERGPPELGLVRGPGGVGEHILRKRSEAAAIILRRLYKDQRLPERPVSDISPLKEARNQESYDRYMAGERAVDLAKEFGVSVRRINKLIRQIRSTIGR
jgi:hypothetical protein